MPIEHIHHAMPHHLGHLLGLGASYSFEYGQSNLMYKTYTVSGLEDLLSQVAAGDLVSSMQSVGLPLGVSSIGTLMIDVANQFCGQYGSLPSLNESPDCANMPALVEKYTTIAQNNLLASPWQQQQNVLTSTPTAGGQASAAAAQAAFQQTNPGYTIQNLTTAPSPPVGQSAVDVYSPSASAPSASPSAVGPAPIVSPAIPINTAVLAAPTPLPNITATPAANTNILTESSFDSMPNWALLVGAALGLWLLMGRK